MPSPTRKSAEQADMGRRAAKKILASYPDYGKAPPEYAINLAEYLSFLTPDEISVVMHTKNGVTARCQYLPTNAEIQACLREHEEKQRQFTPSNSGYQRFESVCTPQDAKPDKTPFRPYPKLWTEFADEPWLLKSHTFETLTEASRSLAMFGKESARDVLARRVGA
jgi:hypothetical protein